MPVLRNDETGGNALRGVPHRKSRLGILPDPSIKTGKMPVLRNDETGGNALRGVPPTTFRNGTEAIPYKHETNNP